MTVTYSAEVSTSSLGTFLRLLCRWRGSIYKLLWKEFIVFAVAFFTLSLVYRFALTDEQKLMFEVIAKYCYEFTDLIPISFVLGFYVSMVVSRWWEQFNKIPWPDRMAMFVTANVHGHDERGRIMRRTIMRYLCLSFVITMHSISPGVKKRFPSFSHMTQAGFMLPNEQKIIEDIQTQHNKYFVPLAWAASLVTRARKEGRVKDDFAVKTLIDEINDFRGCLGGLFNFDWISIPLVYTQVVTWAVYTFFVSCLMGSQFVSTLKGIPIPVFTFLQFFFYMGWLKVAECMVNPFGDDDDDFDINSVIDRNLQVSYLVVDEMHAEHPELIKDQYWDEVDFNLPYTVASEPYRMPQPHLGSAMDINVSPKLKEFIVPPSIIEAGNDEDEGIEMHTIRTRFNKQRSRDKSDSPQMKTRVIRPMGIVHNIRRNASRLSRSPVTGQSPLGSRNRQRKMSENSGLTSELPTPSVITNPDDIFHMTDIEGEGEDEVDLKPSSSSKSKLPAFLNKLTGGIKSRSQKSLSSLKSAVSGPQKDDVRSQKSSSSLRDSREQLPLIDERPESSSPPSHDADASNPSRKRHTSKVSNVSQEVEMDTQHALEDLKFRRERLELDQFPRSVSLSGEKVARELGLEAIEPELSGASHGRNRTTSGGPNLV